MIHPLDIKGVWEGMEECKNLGLTKGIGVSNFSCKKLEKRLSIAKIPPAVNQQNVGVLEPVIASECIGALTREIGKAKIEPLWLNSAILECCGLFGEEMGRFGTIGLGMSWIGNCIVVGLI
uniref:D-galacturonic acid reductase 1 n=1 Tax=Solanum tuberosum TaxID=4113 RepID=M1CVT6_SOLTU